MREYCEDCPKFDSDGKVVFPLAICKCDSDWPDTVRINAIGRNGNSDETIRDHYEQCVYTEDLYDTDSNN